MLAAPATRLVYQRGELRCRGRLLRHAWLPGRSGDGRCRDRRSVGAGGPAEAPGESRDGRRGPVRRAELGGVHELRELRRRRRLQRLEQRRHQSRR